MSYYLLISHRTMSEQASHNGNVMIDIETVGTNPGDVIISVGAVRFSEESGVTESFMRSVDIESAEAAGLNIDGATVKWWMSQSEAAREQFTGGDSLKSVLQELTDFVEGEGEGTPVVWANSPAFDCVILEAGYDSVGLSVPWRYSECRDYRTLRKHLSGWPDVEQTGTKHDAVDDAKFQAQTLVQAIAETPGVTL